jgi:LemA protein
MKGNGIKIAIGCFGLLVLTVLFTAIFFIKQKNSFVTTNESIDAQWSQVENQLKRRNDLIPNLNKVADKFTKQERDIYDKIIAGRQAYSNAKTPEDQMKAANAMRSDLSRLLVVVESNPQLKSDQILSNFMYELSGTENRIATERGRYNEAVKAYNLKVKRFPGMFVAPMFGYKERPYFDVPESEQANPEVKFSEREKAK